MKYLNAKLFIIIETILIIGLPVLNYIFAFWGTEILVSFIIALISLIIAHHSYFLAKGTIDSQNSFKIHNEQLNCIIELRNIYSYIISERYQRAKERHPENTDKVEKEVCYISTLCKIHLMFSNDLYVAVKKYIDMLVVYDYRNPWAEGTKDENALEDFSQCMDLLESAMCNEIKKVNKNKPLSDEYNLHYDNLLKWKKRGK